MHVNADRMWTVPEPKGITRTTAMEAEKLKLVSEGCGSKIVGISIIYYMINHLCFKFLAHNFNQIFQVIYLHLLLPVQIHVHNLIWSI